MFSHKRRVIFNPGVSPHLFWVIFLGFLIPFITIVTIVLGGFILGLVSG